MLNRSLIFILIIVLFSSCVESEKERVTRLVKEWDGRRRKFISNIQQLLKDDETLVLRSLVDVKVDAYKLEYSK